MRQEGYEVVQGICELKNLQDPQVEHLLPHKNGKYPERKFDWNNLFWSCSHCNGIKNQKKYDDGIIDCCKNDPELMMTFKLKDGKTEIHIIHRALSLGNQSYSIFSRTRHGNYQRQHRQNET